jgi:hypothetical protein
LTVSREAANGFEGAFEALTNQATGALPVVFDFVAK